MRNGSRRFLNGLHEVRKMTGSRPPNCRVVMFQRRPLPGQHSIERLFEDVRSALPAEVHVETHILPHESRGVVNRVRNMLFARRHMGEINHITGDVHYLALLLPKRTTILTVLDLVSLERLKGMRRILLVLFWYRLPVWRSHRVTVISDWTRNELTKLIPRAQGKVVMIHCPVSTGFYPSSSPARDRPVILQMGTGPNKNLQRVTEALRGLDVHLRIIGRLDRQQLDLLEASSTDFSQAADLADDEMVAEYAGCDFLVFVSTYEGFGLPILEAQASGRPVITSSVASMPEVAGVGALLVDPLDPAQIRRAVCALMQDPALYQSLVQQGLANADRFAARDVATSYAEVYRSIKSSGRKLRTGAVP